LTIQFRYEKCGHLFGLSRASVHFDKLPIGNQKASTGGLNMQHKYTRTMS